ncbi:MAG: glycosyltransferase family 1 protein [Bacteroidia bacterium]|nr:glycosyltransferase family 1 protein [Bacteroidia bacterium]
MKNSLHIISFDIPFPANYGGVIDVFYKLKHLHKIGVSIILHCFEYGGRAKQDALLKYCDKVYYYPRKKFSAEVFLPYLISSRNHPDLLCNLTKDDYPILFEGLHSTYLLDHPTLKNRIKLVRMHNIEHDYYALLAKSEGNIFLKTYYSIESLLLKKYESKLKHAQYILAISPKDFDDLEKLYGEKVKLCMPFHGNNEVQLKSGVGNFCFYHGKLSVAENNHAALFLVNEVFSQCDSKLIIGGDGAGAELKNVVAKHSNIELKQGLSPKQIDELIADAHINIVPTFQSTGIKLKLINVLFRGRFIIANTPMVQQTGLENLCYVADDATQMLEKIKFLQNKIPSETMKEEREAILNTKFNNTSNAQFIARLIG